MGWVETVASSPAQAAAYIKADMAKWGRLIKDAGIREE
jgi:tripartite-type tricarboxylate transporter receptor subunit TctC